MTVVTCTTPAMSTSRGVGGSRGGGGGGGGELNGTCFVVVKVIVFLKVIVESISISLSGWWWLGGRRW